MTRVATRHGLCIALPKSPALRFSRPFFRLPCDVLRDSHDVFAHLEHFPDQETLRRLLPQTLHCFGLYQFRSFLPQDMLCFGFCFIPSEVLEPKLLVQERYSNRCLWMSLGHDDDDNDDDDDGIKTVKEQKRAIRQTKIIAELRPY